MQLVHWDFAELGSEDWRSAVVPGCVHLDLMRHGLIPDPHLSMNEREVGWVDERAWSYRCSFEVSGQRVLRFECLDTICQVFLNGKLVAGHENMFRPLELDVSGFLVDGENVLQVDFEPAAVVGERRRVEFLAAEGLLPDCANFFDRSFVRKAQYMFGWDWGPRLVSCGILGPVTLENSELGSLSSELGGRSDFGSEGLGSRVSGLGGGSKFGTRSPELGEISDRRVELRRVPDEFGESFEFIVDGKPFWARGANWIPEHSFPTLVTPERLRERLTQARDLGINMLRVWGGGFYEQDAFYDLCDELGIFVWQDFMFSCALYPDEGEFAEEVRKEAEYQVARLRHHPCIALWCGNNENQMLHAQGWGDKSKQAPRLYGEHLYDEVLREVVERLDPGRPYVPGSPIGGDDPNSGGVGDQHFWDVWHGRGDWVHYRESTARFCSEFGFASSPSMAVWKRAAVSEFESPEMLWHDKTGKPWETFKGYVGLHYPAPVTLEDWFYYSELNQRDAMREAVEHFRMSQFCAGSLIWQLNDCWPVQSWSLIDCDGHLKAAAHELKRLYAPVLVSLVVMGGECEVWALSDEEDLKVPIVITSEPTSVPDENRRWTFVARLEAGERKLVDSFSVAELDPRRTLLLARAGDARAWKLLCEPKDLVIRPTDIYVNSDSEVIFNSPVVDMFLYDTELEFSLSPNWITGQGGMVKLETRCPIERIGARSLAGRHRVLVWPRSQSRDS